VKAAGTDTTEPDTATPGQNLPARRKDGGRPSGSKIIR
jgi:hypothetical protein